MLRRFFQRKKETVVIDTPQEILDSKKELKQASNAATLNTNKVKNLLVADHVTLRIQIASHGGKHG